MATAAMVATVDKGSRYCPIRVSADGVAADVLLPFITVEHPPRNTVRSVDPRREV
jgi:hypothetical protein